MSEYPNCVIVFVYALCPPDFLPLQIQMDATSDCHATQSLNGFVYILCAQSFHRQLSPCALQYLNLHSTLLQTVTATTDECSDVLGWRDSDCLSFGAVVDSRESEFDFAVAQKHIALSHSVVELQCSERKVVF